MIRAAQVIFLGGQVAFVFRLPSGQVDFSGLFLTLVHDALTNAYIQCVENKMPA